MGTMITINNNNGKIGHDINNDDNDDDLNNNEEHYH